MNTQTKLQHEFLDIEQNYVYTQKEIASECMLLQRDLPTLVAVSKKQSLEKIEYLYSLGHRDFGENYVQEFTEKQKQLSHLTDIRWHLIGALQSNKVKDVVGKCSAIHSISTLSSLRKLFLVCAENNLPQVYFLQLKVDASEIAKSGFEEQELEEVLQFLKEYSTTKKLFTTLGGFMGIGPHLPDFESLDQENADQNKAKVEEASANLEQLFLQFKKRSHLFWHQTPANLRGEQCSMSMGMTSDWKVALKAGSTHLRIGSKLFGVRT